MQRNGTVDRAEGAKTLFVVLDVKLLVEQAPPEGYALSG